MKGHGTTCDCSLVGFESELSNVASRTYWRPGAMHENEFNQWFLGDRVREKIIDSLDFFAIYEGLESVLYFGIQLFNSVSTENAQRLLERLTQVLQSTIPDDKWRGFQFSPVVEVVELPQGMSSRDFGLYIECHLQYRYDDRRQGPMTREGFSLLGGRG